MRTAKEKCLLKYQAGCLARFKASIKLLLIRMKPSVEIMECQAVCCAGAVSEVGVVSGTLEFIVELSGGSVDLI